MRIVARASFLFGIILQCSAQNLNYYFGNLHSHTGFSDGNKDSSSSGISRPDGSYSYAKLSQDFDFLGISEHNHFSTAHNPGFKKPLYQQGITMADNANEDGKFLALFGMEYGVSSSFNGHVLIYGFNKLIGWETGVGGSTADNFDIFNAKSDYASLFKKVKNQPGAFCCLAHPDFDNYSLDGTWEGALANAPYNSDFDSAIVGMPLRNGVATNASSNYTNYAQGDYFVYYKKMLFQGYHLGIGYDHDNHYSNFGRGNGGRLVIMAPSLTRANLYSAMKQMRFYASDDGNAKLKFELNGKPMGSILTGSVYPSISVVHDDADGELADTLRIWRGYRNKPGLWADIIYQGLKTNTAFITDQGIRSGYEYFYFVDIKQADGQWIVGSPIWYRPSAPVSVAETNNLELVLYPNPARDKVYISTPSCGDYHVMLKDISGRVVMEYTYAEKDFILETGTLQRGIYFLEISIGNRGTIKKMVLE